MAAALKSRLENPGKIVSAAPRSRGRPLKGTETALKDHIIAAAAELFLLRGYGRTSTDDVAAAASCSKRTLYSRFKTKAALFEAVITKLVADLRVSLDMRTSSEETISARYHSEAEIFVDFLLRPHILGLQTLIQREVTLFPELARIAEEAGGRPVRARFKAILAQDWAPVGSGEDLDFLTEQFFYLIQGPIARRALAGDTNDTPQVLEDAHRAVDFWLRGCGFI